MGNGGESDQWEGGGIEDPNEGMFLRLEKGEEIREE